MSVLDTQVSYAKTAEPMEMPFGGLTHVSPRNHILGENPDTPTGRGTFRMVRVLGTGFLSDGESNTRSHALFTSVVFSPGTCVYLANDITSIADIDVCSDRLPPGHASSHERTTASATEASVMRARVYGTVFHPTCVRTSATNRKHFIWQLVGAS